MNLPLVAILLRELADALEDGDDSEAPKPRKPARKSRDLTFPVPTGPVNELDRQRARQMLRRRGIHT